MRSLNRRGIAPAAVALLPATMLTIGTAGLTATAAASPGETLVPLDALERRCDFGRDSTAPMVPNVSSGTGTARIHTAGSRVVAQVQLSEPGEPGAHFDVELIQEPRNSGCAPGQPGVAVAALDTDGAGAGTVTVTDAIAPGATGAWVSIARPNEHSQNPAEFYTSQFVAPV
jgi:hypothetical protein